MSTLREACFAWEPCNWTAWMIVGRVALGLTLDPRWWWCRPSFHCSGCCYVFVDIGPLSFMVTR